MNYLEDTRYDDIGSTFLFIPELYSVNKDKTVYSIEAYYIHHAILAYYFSAQTLEDFENSKNYLNQGRASHSAITTWFFSIEAFINILL